MISSGVPGTSFEVCREMEMTVPGWVDEVCAGGDGAEAMGSIARERCR